MCQLNGAISFWRKSSLAAKGSDLSLLQFLYQECIILPVPSLSKKAYLQTFHHLTPLPTPHTAIASNVDTKSIRPNRSSYLKRLYSACGLMHSQVRTAMCKEKRESQTVDIANEEAKAQRLKTTKLRRKKNRGSCFGSCWVSNSYLHNSYPLGFLFNKLLLYWSNIFTFYLNFSGFQMWLKTKLKTIWEKTAQNTLIK